ncbi:malate dehydrogenase (oxaloacetate-decarboxylating) [Rhizoctonia solani AG-1 IB]|uniref:Malic enzyme n=1 Tax=Thanatephorus cucumeris (strain AG1-IB / isolate 7/3/14) TaxID=1108050 RepID=A0A0B7F617_THACB|nr:malate dehydrogenase (oxaloacetate-decarboxylating) [Rhizoctonia solani AG-1 IB]
MLRRALNRSNLLRAQVQQVLPTRPVTIASATSKTKNLVPIQTSLRADSLLNTPRLNKGAAFSREERAIFGLEGFLPYDIHTLEIQVERAWNQLQKQPTNLLKHAFLASLRDQNQVLFYRLMQDHLSELLSILYTPTAGEAIQQFSHLFRRPIGCFLSYPNADGMRAQLEAHVESLNYEPDVSDPNAGPIDLIVVTDSEAILGIGDQGVGGITIATSKAALYTLGAGINPNRILPVVLDVGTDNHLLFSDPLYMGWKHTRVRGEPYNRFVDKFVKHISALFPDALIHFEDFGNKNAQRLLDKYQSHVPVFNDDIQGTGAVTLAAVMSALRITGQRLSDSRIVLYGAGSAGMGIVNQIRQGMVLVDGLSREEANKKFWCLDADGLLLKSSPNLRPGQEEYARDPSEVQGWKRETVEQDALRLIDVVREVKPTILIGTSTHSRAFTEEVVKEMAKSCERPVILPLSNPTSLAEIDPADAMVWTNYTALCATGSPFPLIQMPDGTTHKISEANNAICYPALGLGTVISRSRTLSPGMIMAGVQALAELAPNDDRSLLPDLADVRSVSVHIAAAVVRRAVEEGHAKIQIKGDNADVEEYIKKRMWDATYRPLEFSANEHDKNKSQTGDRSKT